MPQKTVKDPKGTVVFSRKTSQNDIRSKSTRELEELVKMTDNIIYKTEGVSPFDAFPDRIYIEQHQIVIVYRQFLYTSQDHHFLIEDILSPVVEAGLIFATLKLELGPGGFQQDPPPVRYLKRNDAFRVKNIIIGLKICYKENIDLTKMLPREIREYTEKIGRLRVK